MKVLIYLRLFLRCLKHLASAFRCLCLRDIGFCHFDAEQSFVQSNLEGDVVTYLPQCCGEMSGKVVRLKPASRS